MKSLHALARRSAVLLLVFASLPAACVDTDTIAPARIDASPRFICPCEPVTLDWHCARNRSGTLYCDRIDVRSTSPDADPGVGPREKEGTRELPRVCVATVWTLDTEYRGETNTTSTNVLAIAEDTPIATTHELAPRCDGATLVWESLPLKDLNSSCVGVAEFCNRSGFDLRISVEDGETFIQPAGCTMRLNGPSRNLAIVPATVPFVTGGGICAPEQRFDLLAPIVVTVTRECNRDLEDCDL